MRDQIYWHDETVKAMKEVERRHKAFLDAERKYKDALAGYEDGQALADAANELGHALDRARGAVSSYADGIVI